MNLMKSMLILFMFPCFLLAESSSATNGVLNQRTLWGLKWDLRQLVIEDSYQHYLEEKNLMVIDLSLLHSAATANGEDLGYNKAHEIASGKKLSEVLQQIELTYDFKIRDAAYITIFTRQDVYLVRHMSLACDDRKLADYILAKGDVILVSLRTDFY